MARILVVASVAAAKSQDGAPRGPQVRGLPLAQGAVGSEALETDHNADTTRGICRVLAGPDVRASGFPDSDGVTGPGPCYVSRS